MFYAWECVSVVLSNRTTVDFVIKDSALLMCLLHVLNFKAKFDSKASVNNASSFRLFKFLKFKMKLGY